jgi:exonuclease III
MDVSLIHVGPQIESGSPHGNIFPSDGNVFHSQGQSVGRPRKYCAPICLERIASWNVEGLRGEANTKLFELRLFMKNNGISILCIQETHLHGVHYYIEDGFTLFLSGSAESSGRSYAGVGFLVAPWAIKSIISFRDINDRLASLRIKQFGGVLTVLSVYAPHNGHQLEDRQLFFSTLSENTRIRNKHSSTFVCGDLNAQLGQVGMGEEDIIGPHVYRKVVSKLSTTSNRELLLEYCIAHSLCMANTFFDYPDLMLVSYFNLATQPLEPVTAGKFCQLDHVLCDQQDLDLVEDCVFFFARTYTNSKHYNARTPKSHHSRLARPP